MPFNDRYESMTLSEKKTDVPKQEEESTIVTTARDFMRLCFGFARKHVIFQ